MLIKGEVAEEDCDGMVWPSMEFEIVMDKKREIASHFSISHHDEALLFLKTMLKQDKALSENSKQVLQSAVAALEKATASDTGEFVTTKPEIATRMARAFMMEHAGSTCNDYIQTIVEEE